MQIDSFFNVFSMLLENVPVTLYLALMSFLWSVILGGILTIFQESSYKPLAFLTKLYIDVIRGAPLLLLILLVFYGGKLILTSYQINPRVISDEAFGIFAISISMAAYFSELMRSSYRAVNVSQKEAIYSANIPFTTGFVRILFPQALIIALPNLSNLLINLVKLTSLVSVIGIVDVFNRAQKISKNSYGLNQIAAFIGVILIYWILNVLIFVVLKKIEKKYNYLLN
jgi:His/Glu/Gln/Arg/opine family amino acid ABC transporter permease subunit